MKDYTVHVVRDGKFWVISVDGVAGGTQARNVAEIETMALDFVHLSDGIAESGIRLQPFSLPV